MANSTKRIIMQTFEEMLEEQPFGKITVSALVSRSGISSNTFYYHYKDIFDLLEAWMNEAAERYKKETAGIDDWAEVFKVVLHDIQKRSKLVHHIFDSLSRERMERYMFTSVEERFYLYVKEYTAGINISDQRLMLISNFYCYSIQGFFLKFLWEDMQVDVDTTIDELKQMFDGTLEYTLKRIEGNENAE